MRSRLPIALGLCAALCCIVAGSPQSTTPARKKTTGKKSTSKKTTTRKTSYRRRTRRPPRPSVSAAMRADAVEHVNRYLTESGEQPFEQPGALAPFFEQLMRLGPDSADSVHILHWGDSHTAADEWTGGLRDLFQERFGNGGSGFSLPGHPFPGYRRFDARGGGTTAWQTVGGRAGNGDGWFGLGGVGIYTQRALQSVWLEADCDQIEIHFLQQPRGGRVALYEGDGRLGTISTEGETAPGFAHYTVSPGTHRFLLRTLDARPVRLFGWVADRAGGVTYEALGLNGAEAQVILKWDQDMLATYLQRRNPGLIVLAYGTNEASDPEWHRESYRDMFAQLITRLRRMAPAASILVVGPDDRWTYSRGWHVLPGVDDIIAEQKAVCRELGCAYWDLRQRMGGSGSMRDWVYAGFAQPDHVHFTSIGYRRLSAVLFGDLMQQFDAYRKSRITTDQNSHERPDQNSGHPPEGGR